MNIADAERRMLEIAERLGVPASRLPTVGRNYESGARPFLEETARGIAYVVDERGIERDRRETNDIDELMYWIFVMVTGETASRWAASLQDRSRFRVNMFSEQLRLLAEVDAGWARKRLDAMMDVLRKNPLPDGQTICVPPGVE